MLYEKIKPAVERDQLLTIQEAAEMLHIHTNTLRRWSDEGKIVSLRINSRGDRRYRQQDIEDFLATFNSWLSE